MSVANLVFWWAESKDDLVMKKVAATALEKVVLTVA